MSIDKRNKERQKLGEVQIADDVVAVIAHLAANEVEGVAHTDRPVKKELQGKFKMKNFGTGVKVDVLEGVVTVVVVLTLRYNYNIMEVSRKVQKKVKDAIENMTGLEVADVNIKVAGIEMER
jgi:uncharacterized alkaline shock family protein YloU